MEATDTAAFSPCRLYRYSLTRRIDGMDFLPKPNGTLLVIGLNPSTADEKANDPTITRLMRRAAMLGFELLTVCNLFAFRATDPKVMLAAEDPIGPDNDHFLLTEATSASMVVCAWGTHGTHRGRGRYVRELLEKEKQLHHFRMTKAEEPEHPLYLPYEITPTPLERLSERLSERQKWEKP